MVLWVEVKATVTGVKWESSKWGQAGKGSEKGWLDTDLQASVRSFAFTVKEMETTGRFEERSDMIYLNVLTGTLATLLRMDWKGARAIVCQELMVI